MCDNCPVDANPDQTDADLDGSGEACDCDDFDSSVFPGATEVNDGIDNSCDGLVDELSGTSGFFDPTNDDMFSWDEQPGATLYQVIRGEAPDFLVGCTPFVTSSEFLIDPTVPGSGVTLYYLPRSIQPFRGSFGADSSGNERNIPCAP